MLEWKDVLSKYKQPHNIWHKGSNDENPDHACNRIHQRFLNFSIVPKFTLPAETAFFTIGSCFARNIEMALINQGIRVNTALYETRKFAARDSRYGDAALLHRFNAPSMQLEIENYTEANRLGEQLAYPHPNKGGFWDSHYSNNQEPRSMDQIMAGRAYIRSAMSEAIGHAGCAIITLGLSEAIYDKEAGLYLNSMPPGRYAAKSKRFAGVWVSAQETLDCLENIRKRMHTHAGRSVKIIVTVSPVGLVRSFSANDILVANMLSKSQLRVAAAQFSDAHDDVDYFPSYEMVMLAHPKGTWLPDGRHVRRKHVDKITALFCEHYLQRP